jgi:predicted RNase H-like nuclease (RuvC/YqgF family)
MNPAMLKIMRAKKKRPVDPNAPPRPNLLSQDKKLRDQEQTMQNLHQEVSYLKDKLSSLETKLRTQDNLVSQMLARLIKQNK